MLTGLRREAALVEGPAVQVIVSGGRGDAPDRIIAQAGDGYAAIVSFGLAGGLDPELAPGDLVIGTEVTSDGSLEACCARMSDAVAARLGAKGARRGRIAAVPLPVTDPAAKAELRRRTGAVAVDTESGIAARMARRTGAPLVVLRAVSDPADRSLPSWVLGAVRPDGRVDAGAAVRALIRQPSGLRDALSAAADSRAAMASLGRFRPLLPLLPGLVAAHL